MKMFGEVALIAVPTLAALLCGCDGSNSDSNKKEGEWRAVYSQLYLGEGADDLRLRAFVTQDVDDPCALFADRIDPPDGFEFVSVVTQVPAQGHHAAEGDGEELGVSFETVRAGQTESDVAAVAGDVHIKSEPEWNAGSEVALDLTLEFPLEPVQTIECNGAASAETWIETCDCRRHDGSLFSCDNPPGRVETCCQEEVDRTLTNRRSIQVVATYCKNMCAAVTPFGYLCR